MKHDRLLTHRVDDYAVRVHEGDIVAGPYVRLACKQHIDNRVMAARKSGHPLGIFFNAEAADHIIGYFEMVLRLPDTLDDDGFPIPFLLTPANTFIVGSLFGWKLKTGWRRYREAYVEMGKGNAKTPLAAGIGLYGLHMDGEQAAEIYSAATGMDQAKICWLDADRMVTASPELSGEIYQSQNNLAHVGSMSFFRPVSNEKRGKSGPRPHMCLIDELHEHADAVIVNKLRAGAKRRKQPLFLEITNSGFDRTSLCWQHHEHSRKILEGLVEDLQWFSYVCGLDEADDPLVDSACHIKANPNLGIVIQQPYLDRQVMNASNIPAETNTVLRLNFCVWTQAHSAFFNRLDWDACPPHTDADLVGQPCYGGLDLGQSDDFCAWLRLWDLADGRLAVRCRFFIPRAALQKYPDRPYAEWEAAGLLEITEGNTVDYALVEEAVAEDCLESGVREVAYDKRFAEQMAQNLQGADIVMVNTPQGFALNESIRNISDRVKNHTLSHNGNKILAWMADNAVVVTGRYGEQRIDKTRAKEKIDGISALSMGNSRVIVLSDAPPPDPQLVIA
jgi:phage terminase large subunit-like protein